MSLDIEYFIFVWYQQMRDFNAFSYSYLIVILFNTLQVTVWGDYGRIEGKKVFMGIAQIILDELDLNQMVFGWYKLFDTQSLVSGPSSLALSRRSSATSLESFRT